MTKPFRLCATFCALWCLPAGVLAQQRGTVTGTVIEEGTQRPLVGAQIQVAGTQLGGVTNQQGRFQVTNVPAGEREIRVISLGYTQVTQTVTVQAGQTVNADFTLRQTAIPLEGLMVT